MPLDEQTRKTVEAFRVYIEDMVAADERYGAVERRDDEDESTLATRFEAGPSCWFEVAVRPMIPQIRVGFLTNDRQRSEDIELAIQESGGTVGQFVEVGFSDAGLNWPEPPVEHHHDGEESFFFTTPWDIEDLVDLDLDEIRNKTLRMLDGYLIAFGPEVEIEEEDE